MCPGSKTCVTLVNLFYIRFANVTESNQVHSIPSILYITTDQHNPRPHIFRVQKSYLYKTFGENRWTRDQRLKRPLRQQIHRTKTSIHVWLEWDSKRNHAVCTEKDITCLRHRENSNSFPFSSSLGSLSSPVTQIQPDE
jgi:hypothetical protein